MAVYADDASLLPPNEMTVRGRAAIRARYKQLFARSRMEVRFEADEVGVNGGAGFIRGRTIGRRVSADGRVEDLTGKFVMLLRNGAGGWVISALIWNADR